jgi:hypothetical protein
MATWSAIATPAKIVDTTVAAFAQGRSAVFCVTVNGALIVDVGKIGPLV